MRCPAPTRSLAALALAAGLAACGAPAADAPLPDGSDAYRTLLSPAAFAGGSLEVPLAAGERAAVFLLNAGGRDGAAARLETRAVAAPPTRSTWQAHVAEATPFAPGDSGVLEVTRALAPLLAQRSGGGVLRQALGAPAAPPERTSFCVLSNGAFTESARRFGRLVATGAQALVYADEAALHDLPANEAAQLAAAFDERIHPALTRLLGAAPDVDANGKVILFVTELPQLWGYYWASDALFARDTSPTCSGTRANAADVVYLALPSAVTRIGWTRAQTLGEILPGVLAHEFAHLLSFNRRCIARRCAGPDETWIEEGIAKVAEDEAGYGWNASRTAGVTYLTRTRGDVFRGYDGRSLTRWEGDSVGNYEGAHAFFRFHADRLGPGILAALTSGATGTRNVEQALGIPLPHALADVAVALMFSNTGAPAAEAYSFTGAGWTPLREKLRTLDAVPIGDGAPGAASLRTDGWNAFVSGPAGPGGGAVRVTSGEATKPWVAVVRFRGDP